MANREIVRDDTRDALDPSGQEPPSIPPGLDRRKFLFRGAVISAAAVMNGCTRADTEKNAPPPAAAAEPAQGDAPAVPLSADLNVVKKE